MLGLGAEIPIGCLGPKAEYVLKLYKSGFKVPESIFIPIDVEICDSTVTEIIDAFKQKHTRLAVRSSSLHEDGMMQSMAGLFHSVLNVPVKHVALKQAMLDCRNHTPHHINPKVHEIGLIIQEMIAPQVSGLMFTEDPTDQNSGIVLEWVDGHLESLVQGEVVGTRIQMSRQDCMEGISMPTQFPEIEEMISAIDKFESITSGPADIEWAIADGCCYILQIRPISSHQTSNLPEIMDLSVHSTYSKLPKRISDHHKIIFREACLENDLPISHGNLLVINFNTNIEQIANAHSGWGNSMAVLLTPQRMKGEIQRVSFIGSKIEKLLDFLKEIKHNCPRFTILTKELQETTYTGLALFDEYGTGELEISAGHFLSKGLAEPWRFQVVEGILQTNNGNQATKSMTGINIKEGAIMEDNSEIKSPHNSQLIDAVKMVSRIQQHYPKHCIEFGICSKGAPFLIDHFPSEIGKYESSQVLSPGAFSGTIIRIEDDDAIDSIDSHFHDLHLTNEQMDIIIVANRPRLSLAKYLPSKSGRVGFLFENGSRLCHLAVLLRERNIPAMFVGDQYNLLDNGIQASFDTSSGSLIT